jgi:hypothetical protein
MKLLQWLIPAVTGSLLIRLSDEVTGFLFIAGVAVGGFQLFAAILWAWKTYVSD